MGWDENKKAKSWEDLESEGDAQGTEKANAPAEKAPADATIEEAASAADAPAPAEAAKEE